MTLRVPLWLWWVFPHLHIARRHAKAKQEREAVAASLLAANKYAVERQRAILRRPLQLIDPATSTSLFSELTRDINRYIALEKRTPCPTLYPKTLPDASASLSHHSSSSSTPTTESSSTTHPGVTPSPTTGSTSSKTPISGPPSKESSPSSVPPNDQ